MELKNIHELYDLLIDNTLLGIWVLDNEIKTSFVNSRMTSILGYTVGEMLGKSLYDFIEEKDRKIADNIIKRRRKGISEIVDFRFLHKSGKYVYTRINTEPIIGANGIFKGAIALIEDISEREKIKKTIEALARFPTENPNPNLRVNKKKILYCNPAAKTFFNIQDNSEIPDFLRDIVKKSLLNNSNEYLEVQINELTFALDITPIKEKSYVNIYGRDITKRKKTEEALRLSENKYHEAYDRSVFYKDVLSHDINNILQGILSSTEMVYKYIETTPDLEKIKKTLDLIYNQVFRGAQLVSNIKNLSNIDNKIIPIRNINICEILKEILSTLSEKYKNKSISIKFDYSEDEYIIQGNDLITDVFENIMSNAIRYNENPQIELQINIRRIIDMNNKYIKIEFIDNGIGISKENKKIIFDKGRLSQKRSTGMGIGLYLVKKIIENCNGKIWVENKVKDDHTKGTIFIICFQEAI